MRRLLFLVLLSALLAPQAARVAVGRANFQRQKQSACGLTAIEAYCKSLERHFRRNARAARFFVDALPEGGSQEPAPEGRLDWHEVKNEGEMLDAERAYARHSIVVKAKDGEIVYADFARPLEHSRSHTQYCFRPDGTLAKLTYDYYGGVAGVHVTGEQFYDAQGRMISGSASSRCFSVAYTSRGARERRVSCRTARIREELATYGLHSYRKNADLPGYETLRR